MVEYKSGRKLAFSKVYYHCLGFFFIEDHFLIASPFADGINIGLCFQVFFGYYLAMSEDIWGDLKSDIVWIQANTQKVVLPPLPNAVAAAKRHLGQQINK